MFIRKFRSYMTFPAGAPAVQGGNRFPIPTENLRSDKVGPATKEKRNFQRNLGRAACSFSFIMLEKKQKPPNRRSSLTIYFNYSCQNSIKIKAWYFTNKL